MTLLIMETDLENFPQVGSLQTKSDDQKLLSSLVIALDKPSLPSQILHQDITNLVLMFSYVPYQQFFLFLAKETFFSELFFIFLTFSHA